MIAAIPEVSVSPSDNDLGNISRFLRGPGGRSKPRVLDAARVTTSQSPLVLDPLYFLGRT